MPQQGTALGHTFRKQRGTFVCWTILLHVVGWSDRVCLEEMSRIYSQRTQKGNYFYDNIAYKPWDFHGGESLYFV